MGGHWSARADPWYDQRPVYCALTGQLIPGRAWVVELDGQRLSFSDPASEQLYRRYVLADGQATATTPPAGADAG